MYICIQRIREFLWSFLFLSRSARIFLSVVLGFYRIFRSEASRYNCSKWMVSCRFSPHLSANQIKRRDNNLHMIIRIAKNCIINNIYRHLQITLSVRSYLITVCLLGVYFSPALEHLFSTQAKSILPWRTGLWRNKTSAPRNDKRSSANIYVSLDVRTQLKWYLEVNLRLEMLSSLIMMQQFVLIPIDNFKQIFLQRLSPRLFKISNCFCRGRKNL